MLLLVAHRNHITMCRGSSWNGTTLRKSNNDFLFRSWRVGCFHLQSQQLYYYYISKMRIQFTYQLASMLGSTHEIANIVPFFVASSTSTKIRWKSGGLITLLLFPFARYCYIRINRQCYIYTPPPGPKVLTPVYVCRCIFLIPLFPLLLLSNSKYIARSPQAFHQFDAICSHYRLFWSLH